MPSKGYRTSHYRKTHTRKLSNGHSVRIGSTLIHGHAVKKRKK